MRLRHGMGALIALAALVATPHDARAGRHEAMRTDAVTRQAPEAPTDATISVQLHRVAIEVAVIRRDSLAVSDTVTRSDSATVERTPPLAPMRPAIPKRAAVLRSTYASSLLVGLSASSSRSLVRSHRPARSCVQSARHHSIHSAPVHRHATS